MIVYQDIVCDSREHDSIGSHTGRIRLLMGDEQRGKVEPWIIKDR